MTTNRDLLSLRLLLLRLLHGRVEALVAVLHGELPGRPPRRALVLLLGALGGGPVGASKLGKQCKTNMVQRIRDRVM